MLRPYRALSCFTLENHIFSRATTIAVQSNIWLWHCVYLLLPFCHKYRNDNRISACHRHPTAIPKLRRLKPFDVLDDDIRVPETGREPYEYPLNSERDIQAFRRSYQVAIRFDEVHLRHSVFDWHAYHMRVTISHHVTVFLIQNHLKRLHAEL